VKKKIAFFAALLALAGASSLTQAQTCTAASGGTWFQATQWTCTAPAGNRIPLATDNVVIGNFAITVGTADAVAASLDLASGNNNGSLTISAGRSLSVTGNVNLSGSTLVGNNRSKSIIVAGTLSAATLAVIGQGGNTRQAQLVINNGTVNVAGDITVAANANTDILFCTSGTCGATADGTLNVGGDFGNGAQLNPGTGTVNYNGAGAQDIGLYAYNDLSVTKRSGSASLAGDVTVAGDMAVTCPAACAGGTLDLNAFTADRAAAGGTLTLGVGARLAIGGSNSFPANYATSALSPTSTVEYDGSAQTIAAKNYGNLVISGARGASDVTLANAGTIGIAGTFSPSASFTTGNYVVANSTVNFNGSGAQTVPAFDYNKLTVSGVRSGSVTFANGGTIRVARTFSPSATFSSGGYVTTNNTMDFDGTVAQTVPAFDYYNLTISAARGANNVTLANGGTVGIAGIFNPAATFTSGDYVVTNNTVEYNGAAPQALNAFDFENLHVNNANGLTLAAGNATVSGRLTLETGVVTTTGPSALITAADCDTPSVSRTFGHIAGRLQKTIPTGNSSCVFEIGGASGATYTPVTLTYAGIASPGNVVAAVTAGDHPSLNGSGIEPTKSVNLYWTLSTPATGPLPSAAAGSTFQAVFAFGASDDDGAANPAAYTIKRYASGTWTGVTVGTRTLTSTEATGLALAAGYGDFALGEPAIVNFTREKQFIYTREVY
jgi:hypothetical protein